MSEDEHTGDLTSAGEFQKFFLRKWNLTPIFKDEKELGRQKQLMAEGRGEPRPYSFQATAGSTVGVWFCWVVHLVTEWESAC